MAQNVVKHGTWAGYKAELQTNSVCDRCRAASRVYNNQYSRANKAKGVHYTTDQVIDHLYKPGKSPIRSRASGPEPRQSQQNTYVSGQARPDQAEVQRDVQSQPGPSLADRLSAAMGRLTGQESSGNDYVETGDAPDYISASDPDPEPNDNEGWSVVTDEDLVITKAGLDKIEGNLGTYLSVVGITFEMIDPYCGPILAENFDNIVSRWTKVIARYPKAAKFFMSEDGGTIFTWIGAIQATWPVLMAIYRHHLAKTIKTDKEGRIYEVHPNGSRPTVDATTPPMPEYDYAVQ
jgi:hypothetical protein